MKHIDNIASIAQCMHRLVRLSNLIEGQPVLKDAIRDELLHVLTDLETVAKNEGVIFPVDS